MRIIYEWQPDLKERIKHLAEYTLNKLLLPIGFIELMNGNWYAFIFIFLGVLEWDFKIKKGKEKILFDSKKLEGRK